MGHSPLACLYSRFAGYIEERRREPRHDVLTAMATTTFPDGSLPEVIDVVRLAANLFSAGQETTVRLLAYALQTLGERPDLQQLLRDDPGRSPTSWKSAYGWRPPAKGVSTPCRSRGEVLRTGWHADLPAAIGAATAIDVTSNVPPVPNSRHNSEFPPVVWARHPRLPGMSARPGQTRISLARLLARTQAITISEAAHGPAGNRSYEYAPTYILRGLQRLELEFTPAGQGTD